MGYNGREFRESLKMGVTSNGLGSFAADEGLAVSMSNLSVTGGDQSTSASNDQSPLLSSSQSQSNLSRSTSTSSPSLTVGRTNLNPNAAEFVPNAFKAPSSVGKPWEQQKSSTVGEKETVGSRLDRTNSSNSNASDDEYRRFCRSQLPDDLMPDFDFGDFVESTTADYEEPASLDVQGRSPMPTNNWVGGSVGNARQGEHFIYDDRVSQNTTVTYSPSAAARYGVAEGSTSTGFVRPYMLELRGSQQVNVVNRDGRQPGWTDGNETGTAFTEWGGSDLTFPEDLAEVIDPVAVLAAEFPGFASESLADIYYANGGDLALTMDMLTELEVRNKPLLTPDVSK